MESEERIRIALGALLIVSLLEMVQALTGWGS